MLSNFVTACQIFSLKNPLKNIVTTHLDLVFMFLVISTSLFDSDKNLTYNMYTLSFVLHHI
jgi:hypothetical protein